MGKSIYVFFFGSFDLLCVNLETKVSSQLSSNCNIWWIRPRAKMAAPDWPSHRETPGQALGLGSVVASVQILGRRAILGGVSLGCGRFLPVLEKCTQLTSVNFFNCKVAGESSGGRFLSELRTSPLFLRNFQSTFLVLFHFLYLSHRRTILEFS